MSDTEFKLPTFTPEQLKAIEEQAAQDRVRDRRIRVDSIIAAWNAPRRHADCKTDRAGEWEASRATLAGLLGSGMIAALVGDRGNGKTQMAVELMRTCAIERLASCHYLTATEFFIRLKGTYRKDSCEDEASVLQDLRRPKLLVIDEIGKRSESEWEGNVLFELLNKRYGDMTDTLLIDNRSKADFLAMIGPSLGSRMKETGGVIECNWPSFR